MNIFFQHVFALLTTPAGGLTYQLVLAFSIGAALAGTIGVWRSVARPVLTRLLVGLGLLLALRLVLFAAGGLVWQGALDVIWLAPLDRAVGVLSLLTLLWLWLFPEPVQNADVAALLLAFLLLTLSVLGFVWWSEAGAGRAFSSSTPDRVANLLALGLTLGGFLLLAARRPAGWPIAAAQFGFLAAGQAAYLWQSGAPNAYAVVRLSEMIAYPLLLALPQRYPLAAEPERRPAALNPATRPRAGADVFAMLAGLIGRPEPFMHCQTVTQALAEAMLADLCLWLAPPDADGQIVVVCGYNRHSARPLPEVALTSREVPVLAAMLRRGKALRLPASSTSPDLGGLARRLTLDRTGHMLAIPLMLPDTEPLGGLVFISPYTDRPWRETDEQFLSHIASLLTYLIATADIRAEAALARKQTAEMRSNLALQAEELNELRSSAGHEREQIERLQVIVAAQEAAHEVVVRLRAENESLRQALNARPAQEAAPRPAPPVTESAAYLEDELREALSENARLQSLLPEVDRLALAKEGVLLAPSERQQIAHLARELRQPMSSILGYTDFLLGESIGILGALQRKFLERVRLATERMDRLVKELLQTVAPEDASWRLGQNNPVNLSAAIDAAIDEINGPLREKAIALRVDLPDVMPRLSAEPQALHTILTTLLQNAGEVSQPGGEILLHAHIERGDSAGLSSEQPAGFNPPERAGSPQNYILLQVADHGPGIPQKATPAVFGSVEEDAAEIPGLGLHPSALGQARRLVEKMGGRIWVESPAQAGATFSVLFPVLPAPDAPTGQETQP